MPSLRSKAIRLAHTNPTVRPHLLPLLTRRAELHIPTTGLVPKYEKNVMAVPTAWADQGRLAPHTIQHHIIPLYERAKNGVAFILDPAHVLAPLLPTLSRTFGRDLADHFGEAKDMALEGTEDHYAPGNPKYRYLDNLIATAAFLNANDVHMFFAPYQSPKTGLSGWRLQFTPTWEQIPGTTR